MPRLLVGAPEKSHLPPGLSGLRHEYLPKFKGMVFGTGLKPKKSRISQRAEDMDFLPCPQIPETDSLGR